MSELEIRSVRQEDLEAVVRIQAAILQRSVDPAWINLVKLQMNKPDNICLVAARSGEVIGFFFGEVKHNVFGLEHAGWVEMFGVEPKLMGQGVGSALAKALFDRFREMGVQDVYTAVRWDSGDLLAFFKEIGFTLSNFINLKTRLS